MDEFFLYVETYVNHDQA